jgi:hypothetical protein
LKPITKQTRTLTKEIATCIAWKKDYQNQLENHKATLDKLEVDKENRAPRNMAQAEKKKTTPGRPKKKGNQYWDVGKVGRYAMRSMWKALDSSANGWTAKRASRSQIKAYETNMDWNLSHTYSPRLCRRSGATWTAAMRTCTRVSIAEPSINAKNRTLTWHLLSP